MLTPVVR